LSRNQGTRPRARRQVRRMRERCGGSGGDRLCVCVRTRETTSAERNVYRIVIITAGRPIG